MNRTWKLAVVMMLVALLVTACGGRDKPTVSTPEAGGSTAAGATGQTSPTEQADVKAVDTPAGPAVSAEGEELSVSDREVGLENLDTYRATWKLEWKSTGGAKNEDVTWEWMQEFTREPKAAHWRWESLDRAKPDAKPEAMEFWQIGTTTYIVTGAEGEDRSCMSSSSEDNTVDESPMGPQSLGSVNGAKLVGTETVNGIKARHYRYDEKSMALVGGDRVTGDIWVAVDGGYVVKDTAKWEGKFFGMTSDDTTGSGSWTWELTDINSKLEIKAPEGCESAATGLPILPDATEQASFGDMVTYKSATKLADVVKFYREELTKAGWKEAGESTMTDEMANLTFSTEGATLNLMVSPDDKGTTVILSVQK